MVPLERDSSQVLDRLPPLVKSGNNMHTCFPSGVQRDHYHRLGRPIRLIDSGRSDLTERDNWARENRTADYRKRFADRPILERLNQPTRRLRAGVQSARYQLDDGREIQTLELLIKNSNGPYNLILHYQAC